MTCIFLPLLVTAGSRRLLSASAVLDTPLFFSFSLLSHFVVLLDIKKVFTILHILLFAYFFFFNLLCCLIHMGRLLEVFSGEMEMQKIPT